MREERRKKAEPIVCWCLGMILCALGISLSLKSAFGVSMIEAPVNVCHMKLTEYFPKLTYGTVEYGLQAIVLALMCVIVRRFRWKYLLSFATAFVFGFIIDGWNLVFAAVPATTLPSRIAFAVAGCVITAFAVACFFRTWLPLEVWELFVKEVADRYRFDFAKVKWVYDISSLAVAVILMLVFFGRFRLDAIGIGTIVITFINAPLIKLFSLLLDRLFAAGRRGLQNNANTV